MVQLALSEWGSGLDLDPIQESWAGRGLAEEAPALDLQMPRVYRQPSQPAELCRHRVPLGRLLRQAQAARRRQDAAAFGQIYGQLTAEFQPLLQWALSCWDYLLTQQGCRFQARPSHEKLYCRGDYRAFTERDYPRLVSASFKEALADYLDHPSAGDSLESTLRIQFWPRIWSSYQALENPPDSSQRKLTGYSYLRCVPYQFLNSIHHARVYGVVSHLLPPLRQVIELYHLRFLREDAILEELKITWTTFRRRFALALRTIASEDYLSFILLKQIERY